MILKVKNGKLIADGIEVHPVSVELAHKAIVRGYSNGNLLQKFEGDYEVPLRVKEIEYKQFNARKFEWELCAAERWPEGGFRGQTITVRRYAILEEVKEPEVILPDAERIYSSFLWPALKKPLEEKFDEKIDVAIPAMHQYGNDLLSYLRKEVELTRGVLSDSRGREVLQEVLTLIDKLKKP